jgi:hypothetical protein
VNENKNEAEAEMPTLILRIKISGSGQRATPDHNKKPSRYYHCPHGISKLGFV